MKRILTFALTSVSVAVLAACANGIPECNNNALDGCGRGGPYTDERTAVGKPKVAAPVEAPVIAPAPIAQPAPVPAPTPEPVPPAPAPAPADTSIMKQAPEPSMTK